MNGATSVSQATSGALVWKDKLVEYIITHSGALISAAVVIFVGLIVARSLGRLTDRWLERKAMEPPMRMLIVRLLRLFIFALALVVALSTAGINMTALIAGISVAGVGGWSGLARRVEQPGGRAYDHFYQAVPRG